MILIFITAAGVAFMFINLVFYNAARVLAVVILSFGLWKIDWKMTTAFCMGLWGLLIFFPLLSLVWAASEFLSKSVRRICQNIGKII